MRSYLALATILLAQVSTAIAGGAADVDPPAGIFLRRNRDALLDTYTGGRLGHHMMEHIEDVDSYTVESIFAYSSDHHRQLEEQPRSYQVHQHQERRRTAANIIWDDAQASADAYPANEDVVMDEDSLQDILIDGTPRQGGRLRRLRGGS